MGGRSVVPIAYYWICVHTVRRPLQENPGGTTSSGVEILELRLREIMESTLPRKVSKHNQDETVPQTDTGGRVEKTKANE